MKICLIADTHFSFKKSNKIYHQYFEKFYSEVFFPTLRERRIDTVVHMGDAFDNRKGIDYWGLEWAYRVFYDPLKDMNIQLFQICGNHDTELKNTNKYNSIDTLLRDYSNVTRITKTEEYQIGNLNCLFVPWICKENQEKTYELIQNTKSKVVFGHLELTGFTLFPGLIQKHGHTKEIYNKFDRVFSGHYHTRSDDGKIFYIGNPYQMYWSDVEDKRGFVIFDTSTYQIEYIQNPFEIYKRIYYSDIDYKDFDYSTLTNKNVKVIIEKKTNQSDYEKFINEILKQDILDLKIVDTINVNDEDVRITEIDCEDTLSVLNKYIQQSDFNLNKDKVYKILYDLYKEALEMEI